MPDAPIAETLSLSLGKWADGAQPGAAALNTNWDAIDAAVMIHGDALPATYQVGKLFLKSDDQVIFRNDGTEDTPIWTSILDVGTVAAAVAAKADQSQVDTIQTDLTAAQGDIVTLQTNDYLKRDGSDPMTGDLDLDSNKALNVANGTDPTDGVNRGQLDAVVASALAGLGTQLGAIVRITANQGVGFGGAPLNVAWDAVVSDIPGGMVDLGTFPKRITITQTGYYEIGVRGYTEAAGADHTFFVRKNGTTNILQFRSNAGCTPGQSPWSDDVSQPILLTVGDYIDLLIYQDANGGHVTTFGGGGLADNSLSMSCWLKSSNAAGGGDLKSNGTVPMTADFDLGGNRAVNGADAMDPTDLTTLQQVEAADAALQSQIDAITEGQLGGDEIIFTGGNQGFSTGGWEVVTGGTLIFTLAAPKFVAIDAHATALMDFEKRANLQLGIRLQRTGDPATDYPGTQCFDALGYYVNGTMVAAKKGTLAAGEWTISLIAKKIFAGAPYNPLISKVAAAPAYLGYMKT